MTLRFRDVPRARLVFFLVITALLGASPSWCQVPSVVPTFECLGITWSPIDGAANNTCTVQYRKIGALQWRQGFPLFFDDQALEYRGSLVHLTPNTTYEIQLTLTQTSTTANTIAATWSESFPVGSTVTLPTYSTSTLTISSSGTPDGYVLYTHAPSGSATIDGIGTEDYNIVVDASYVIIRGLNLVNAAKHAIYFDALAQDVVIEGNDFSGWGRVAAVGFGHGADGALHANSPNLARVIVQRNLFHDPRPDANSWAEERSDVTPTSSGWHPKGPQAITFYNSAGNHVIRYNTVLSDDDHYYNDIFSGGSNCSLAGFPNRDSDIYGNQISHCWDDGIEAEGANRNVRVWGNYIEKTLQAVATRSTSVGPIYIWRNVYGSSRRSPLVSWDDDDRGNMHKAGSSGNCELEGSDRGVFEFHNTILQLSEVGLALPIGASGGPRGRMFNTTTRNNILQIADATSPAMYSIRASLDPSLTNNDFDYDLYNGQFLNVPGAQETNGILGVPVYSPAPSFDPVTGQGVFTLGPASPGYDAGEVLPNFNDGFIGLAPDMGAHEAGTAPMEFGINAYTTTPTGAEEDDIAVSFVHLRNEPNPFHPMTTIRYSLREPAYVTLSIFDARGRRVARVVDGKQSTGPNAFVWSARDATGRSVAPGVYFYRLQINGATASLRKMVLGR